MPLFFFSIVSRLFNHKEVSSKHHLTEKMWYVHTHTHNGILVMKKNEIIPSAATQMDLEIIILSKVSQTEKDKYMI